MDIHPFKIEAFITLPDHLHTIWTLPEDDSDYSVRWMKIKALFSKQYPGPTYPKADSSLREREKNVWQRRFWEHLIRDEEDFNIHCDYIHYNAVKHGLVNSPLEWEATSLRNFIEQGMYQDNWGQSIRKQVIEMNRE
jgi:putative transposase